MGVADSSSSEFEGAVCVERRFDRFGESLCRGIGDVGDKVAIMRICTLSGEKSCKEPSIMKISVKVSLFRSHYTHQTYV